MHYKYLKNNLRTFVEFLDQSIYALFRPAPRIFILALPRPSLIGIIVADDPEPDLGTFYKQLRGPDGHHLLNVLFQKYNSKMFKTSFVSMVSFLDHSEFTLLSYI